MRLIALFLFTASALAQITAKPATHATAHRTTATAHTTSRYVPCTKLPVLSPKIPALPAGLPCAKPLYTIITTPAIKLEDVSPLEVPAQLRETLGIESVSFTLAYIDVKVGPGPLAEPHKFYSINYTGYLTNGTKFDSSYDHKPAEPITIAYGQHQVIPGWDTGFSGMHVGGKRRLFIPYQLAYGTNGHPPAIPGKSELVFDVELVGQSDTPPPPPVAPKPAPKPALTAPAPTAAAPTAPAKPAAPGTPATTPKP